MAGLRRRAQPGFMIHPDRPDRQRTARKTFACPTPAHTLFNDDPLITLHNEHNALGGGK